MPKVIERIAQKTPEDPQFLFHCPGCGYGHWFKTTGNSPKWNWNGDFERPTITPSIVADPDGARHCHSFVNAGYIQFLSDCWHDLKNQTVALPDIC